VEDFSNVYVIVFDTLARSVGFQILCDNQIFNEGD